MPDIKFECPKCGQHIATEEEYAGMSAQCPTCSCSLTIPDVSSAVNTDSDEVIMHIKSDSWESILAHLKLVQSRNIRKLTLVNEKNGSLSLERNEYYIATFDDNRNILTTLSTALTFKKVIEIFEEFYKTQTINRRKIRWTKVEILDGKLSKCTERFSSKVLSENQVYRKLTDFDWKHFFSMNSKNLGCGGIIIMLVSPLLLGLLLSCFGSCYSSSHSQAESYTIQRDAKIKHDVEVNTKQLVNNLASLHRLTVSSLDIQPYVDLNRQEAEAYVYLSLINGYGKTEKWKYHFVFKLENDDQLYFKKDRFSSEKLD